ncbi:hypothetical protein OG749_23285 [Streptomyces nojiriensis]|uniref:hypothetical protein n=1 Tax=Streptomyces nojiriensis TaxID=66374 RepID=UPI002E18706E
MTASNGTAQPTVGEAEAVLRDRHSARARSAVSRAVAACRSAGIDDSQAKLVPNSPESRAAQAVRLVNQNLEALADSLPDPAADARSARNAAAAATLAAEVAKTLGEGGEAVETACRSALQASLAAAQAAGGSALGRDEVLNAKAESAETAAIAAARSAGWL